MPLRDDHEAALARADALQVELDRARAEGADKTARIAKLEAELAKARSRVASSEPTTDSPEKALLRNDPVVWAMLGLGAMLAIVFGLVWCSNEPQQPSKYDPPHAVKVRAPEAAVAPPDAQRLFAANQILSQGLSTIAAPRRMRRYEVRYIDLDGNLDADQGRVTIESTMPSSALVESERDPQRLERAMANCPTIEWTPEKALVVKHALCPGGSLPIKDPSPLPRCSLNQVLERLASTSPRGSAQFTLRVEAEIDVTSDRKDLLAFKWRWTVRAHDGSYDGRFVATFSDDECAGSPSKPVEGRPADAGS